MSFIVREHLWHLLSIFMSYLLNLNDCIRTSHLFNILWINSKHTIKMPLSCFTPHLIAISRTIITLFVLSTTRCFHDPTATGPNIVGTDAIAEFVSRSRIRDSSNRQPLRQVLQKGRYTAVNHTRDIFFISLSYTWTIEE